MGRIKAARGIAGVATAEFPWVSERGRGGAQVDLVVERADGVTDLCEMKFADRPLALAAGDEAELLNKRAVFGEETGTSQALKLVLVSARGVAGVAYTEHVSQVISLDDLFE